MRVLLIEDEPHLREQIGQHLRQHQLTVDMSSDGEDGLFLGTEYPYDVAVIDLGLPKLSGIEVIKQLRQQNITFPILILTARGRWQDKVEGLEAGADDYLVKPFHFEELVARLNALARRAAGWSNSTMRCGQVELNPASQQVTVKNFPIELTAFEYRLLHYLMLHAGEVISKTELTDHIYEQDQDRDSNVIEVFVKRLRNKLDPEKVLNPIETLRGRGYRLTLPRE
ncbi:MULTISPECIES: response regulator transcription factor [unclassified Methylophaga]|jgi:two-component system response regulator PhoP|uniref:response regulator transcription factor n=1 Tax=unclassified Methylophaga TaxID=2629249 RepID=UPI000C98522C|nr:MULTISPECIES: response regulator transcription factor [unclassified Methylophaga]MAK65531.1 DNA-binding response regulator [Methylophaga sp.]MAY16255.1 DNA-binding response regulator [Methylophaga sp.]MBN45243.1 DNA-binding response regulator [Methylophaga sp.]|tara:strand:- start:6124 stop:6801 length:678 start_codon:yes stop_codon:yes gene_type:complete